MRFGKKNQEKNVETADVTCPFCQSSLKVQVRSYISAQKDLGLKVEAMLGRLFHPVCPVCGSQVPISQFLAYEDRDNHSVIYYEPDASGERRLRKTLDGQKEKSGWFGGRIRYRITKTQQDFYEKIRILDCDLDDRIVEIMKLCVIHYFQSQNNRSVKSIRFHIRRDEPVFRVSLEDAEGFFAFSSDDYRTIQDSLKAVEKEHPGFDPFIYRINKDWAAKALWRIQEKYFDITSMPKPADRDPDEDLLVKPDKFLYGA